MINTGTICQNRKARFSYTIIETLEAGIVLEGSEVKSLRMGMANIGEAYATQKDGELYLNNALITCSGISGHFKHIEGRPRKLLLHKKEVAKLSGLMARKGYTSCRWKCSLMRGALQRLSWGWLLVRMRRTNAKPKSNANGTKKNNAF